MWWADNIEEFSKITNEALKNLLPAKFREYDKDSAAEVAQYFVMWERVTALCKILLSLNFTKTQFTNFTTKNYNQIEININYNNKYILQLLYKVSQFNCWLLTNIDKPYWFTDKKTKHYMLLILKY